jgi:hypothetical protein
MPLLKRDLVMDKCELGMADSVNMRKIGEESEGAHRTVTYRIHRQ